MFRFSFRAFRRGQEGWHIILNDAPKRVVIDAEIAMNQPVAGSYYHAPGDFIMCIPNFFRGVGSSFTNQFKVAQSGILNRPVLNEPRLVKPLGIGKHLFSEIDHVIEVKPPFAMAGIRHSPAPVRCKGAVPAAGPFQ